jgi:tetratricopeptide (TPR) repeat protein
LDAYQLEQQALRELSRGQTERALRTYVQILRKDPRDRRIRQKLAELYAKQSMSKEAEKQFRQLVKAYRADGNHRAASSVLQRVLEYSREDGEMWGYLGEAYRNLGRNVEAKKPLEKAWKLLQRRDVKLGLVFATMRLDVAPDDMPYLIKLAEDLEAMNMGRRAFGFYMRAINAYKMRGQSEEMGRLAVKALQISPGQTQLLLVAAEAALSMDDVETGLKHLERARDVRPDDLDVMKLLLSIYQADESKAEQVTPLLRSMAASAEDQNEAETWVTALTALQQAGEDVDAALVRANRALERARFRLTDLEVTQPQDEAQLKVCVRAEVYGRYGFAERVVSELDELIFSKRFPCVVAWRAEIAWLLKDKEEAIRKGTEVLELLDDDSPDRSLTLHRLRTFGASVMVDDDDELVDDEDDELVDDEDDELVDDEDTADADTAPPAAEPEPEPVRDDELNPFQAPLEDDDPFGGVFASGEGTFAEVDPDDMDDPFAGLSLDDEDDDDDPSADDGADAIEDARGLIGMGAFDDAAAALQGVAGLEAATLRARCTREISGPRDALAELREVLDEVDDDDPYLLEARFELAECAARAGKIKLSLRTLKQIHVADSSFRAKEVATRVRLLRKRL